MASLTVVPSVQTGHIGLNVSDLARSKQFYQQVFGFEVLGESLEVGRQFAFLGQNGTPILTLWQQSEGRFATRHVGLHHLAFQVGTIDDVRAFEERLRALGTPFLYDGVVPTPKAQIQVVCILRIPMASDWRFIVRPGHTA
jgi:lactoylglutathione lyase